MATQPLQHSNACPHLLFSLTATCMAVKPQLLPPIFSPPSKLTARSAGACIAAKPQCLPLNYVSSTFCSSACGLACQVRSWPPSLFSMPQLMEAVASRMKRPGGESRELALIMAELYERQNGAPRGREPGALAFIAAELNE
eukprot:505955-Pelagomonas_calceolata.AAC.3